LYLLHICKQWMPNIFVFMVVKRILVLSFIFLWLNQFILAQSAIIIAASDGQSLPYATVINMRTGKGVFASESGQVDFKSEYFGAGDSVKITYTGYEDIFIKLPLLQTTIHLKSKPIELDNVAVYPCLNSVPTILKNYTKFVTNYSLSTGNVPSGSWASFIPNNRNKKGILETITVELFFFTIPSNARKAPYKLRLLHYDSTSGLPGNSLIAKEWVVHPSGKKLILNIKDENLRIPMQGLVVAIDYFFAGEQYTYKRKTRMKKSDGTYENIVETIYGSNLLATKGENLLGKGYTSFTKTGEWRIFNSYQSGVAAPMVSIGLMECN